MYIDCLCHFNAITTLRTVQIYNIAAIIIAHVMQQPSYYGECCTHASNPLQTAQT